MPRPGPKLAEGEELRGFVVRAYLSQEQARALYQMQQECRLIWNYLVEQHHAYIDRVLQRAHDDGAIVLRPKPDKSANRREYLAWQWERTTQQIVASKHVRKIDGYEWPAINSRAEFYAPLRERAERELGRDLVGSIDLHRTVTVRFAAARVPKHGGNWRPPRFKREEPPWYDRTMLQLRDTHALRYVGSCGWRGKDDCMLHLCGMQIPCRAGREWPRGTAVRGVSLVHKADGWYAAVRLGMPPRGLPAPRRGTVGVCFGLETLCSTSEGESWENPRGNEYSKLCAWRDERAAELEKEGKRNEAFDVRMQNSRYQLRMARQTKQLIYADILPMLGRYETIVLGTVHRKQLQGAQCALGEDDDGGVTSAASMLRDMICERYRGRVAQIAENGFDRQDPIGAARKLVAMHAELQAAQ